MARVLLTTVEPLPGSASDVSAVAARILEETWHGTAEIIHRPLPATYAEASKRLRASVAKHLPDAVIVVDARPGDGPVTVERLAVNLDDAAAPDADGVQPVDMPVVEGGPAALWSTLPVKPIAAALDERGLPVALSLDAGSGLANHVFYVMQRELAEWGVPSGLVRLPSAGPLPPVVLAEALRTVVDTVVGVRSEPAAPAEPEPQPKLEEDEESLATQPFLMPITEPIAGTTPPYGLPVAEPQQELAEQWEPEVADKAPVEQAAPEPEPADEPADAEPSYRAPTWEEIITGRSAE